MARRKAQISSVSDLFASLERSASLHVDSSQEFVVRRSGLRRTHAKAKYQQQQPTSGDSRGLSAVLNNLTDFSAYERHELVVDSCSSNGGGASSSTGGKENMPQSTEAYLLGGLKQLNIEKPHPTPPPPLHPLSNVRQEIDNLVCSTPGQAMNKGTDAFVRLVPLEHLQATPIPCPEESLIPLAQTLSTPHQVPRPLASFNRSELSRQSDSPKDESRTRPDQRDTRQANKKSAAFIKRLSRRFRVDNMILNQSYWTLYEAGNPKATLLKLCKQQDYGKFSQVFTSIHQRRSIVKIGEGCFGEVFRCIAKDDPTSLVAIKLVPIEGSVPFNGDPQKTFNEVLSEVIVSKELTALSLGCQNRTENFVQLRAVHLVQGAMPSYLIKAWDRYNEERKSENDNPRIFPRSQLWLVVESAFSGSTLEHNVPPCPAVRLGLLRQISLALACAEAELRFEHRDLHWGNILIRSSRSDHPSNSKSIPAATTDCPYCEGTTSAVKESSPMEHVLFRVNDRLYNVPSFGFLAVIIDFTLSRLEQDGGVVYVDLESDQDLFNSHGDYQFDIYRLMRQHNKNRWDVFSPKSNIMWLHYLAVKLAPPPPQQQPRLAASLSPHADCEQQLLDLERALSSFAYDSAVDLTSRHPLFVDLC